MIPRHAMRALEARWPWALAIITAAALSCLKVRQHLLLQTQAYDLGIYANMLWNTLHGRWFWISFAEAHYLGDHFAPLMLLCAPLLWVWQNAGVLLIFQCAAIGAAIPAAAGLARRLTGKTAPAAAFAFWWVLSPYVHRVNRYDFHEMAVVMAMILWAILFWESGRFRAFWITALVSLLWREDVGLLWAGFGAAQLLRERAAAGRRRAGLLILVGVAYTAAAVLWAIPAFGSWRFVAEVYRGLGGSPGEIAGTLLRPDKLWAQSLGQAPKALGAAQLFFSTGGLPLLAPSTWPSILLPMAINTLSDRPWQYKFEMHYAAGSLPFLFWGMVHGWASLEKTLPARGRQWLPALWIVLLGAAAWRWKPYYAPAPAERRAALRELVALVPPGDSVLAQTNLLPHLAFRQSLSLAPAQVPARWVALDAAPVGFTTPPDYRQWLEGFHRQWSGKLVFDKAGLRLYRAD